MAQSSARGEEAGAQYARSREKRLLHYRELLKLTRATLAYADQAATLVSRALDPIAVMLWQAELRHYRPSYAGKSVTA